MGLLSRAFARALELCPCSLHKCRGAQVRIRLRCSCCRANGASAHFVLAAATLAPSGSDTPVAHGQFDRVLRYTRVGRCAMFEGPALPPVEWRALFIIGEAMSCNCSQGEPPAKLTGPAVARWKCAPGLLVCVLFVQRGQPNSPRQGSSPDAASLSPDRDTTCHPVPRGFVNRRFGIRRRQRLVMAEPCTTMREKSAVFVASAATVIVKIVMQRPK